MNTSTNRYHFRPGFNIERLTLLLTVKNSRFQPQSCGTWSTKPGSQRPVNSKKRNEENKYNMHQNTTTYDNVIKNKGSVAVSDVPLFDVALRRFHQWWSAISAKICGFPRGDHGCYTAIATGKHSPKCHHLYHLRDQK